MAKKKETTKLTELQLFLQMQKLDLIPEPEIVPKPGDKFRLYDTTILTVEEVLYDNKVISYINFNGILKYALSMDMLLVEHSSTSVFTKAWANISTYNTDLSSIYSKVFYFGLDINPPYQRDLVWSLENKKAYIKHLFDEQNTSGLFVLYHNDYGSEYLYEVIDGKQRINALIEFKLNKLSIDINGKEVFYRELSPLDVRLFNQRVVNVAVAKDLTNAQKIKLFLNINQDGVKVDSTHLEYLNKRYEVLNSLYDRQSLKESLSSYLENKEKVIFSYILDDFSQHYHKQMIKSVIIELGYSFVNDTDSKTLVVVKNLGEY